MNELLTDKMIRATGRVWIPISRQIEDSTKAASGSSPAQTTPCFAVGVAYGVVIAGEIVRGEIVAPLDSPMSLNTVTKGASEAVEAFFSKIPDENKLTVTAKDTAAGRVVSASIPPVAAETAPTAAPAAPPPAADAAPRRRGPGRPPAAPKPAPAPSEPAPEDFPGEPGGESGEASEPVSPSGLTLTDLKNQVCHYGKVGGQMNGKKLGELAAAHLEWLARNPDFDKFANQPGTGFGDLRTWAIELIDLKKVVGEA